MSADRMPKKQHDPHAHVIHVPGKRLMYAVPLKFVWNKVTGQSKRSVAAELNLVAFIDTLLITVIFLLMTFSASGSINVDENITLPQAENAIDIMEAPMVAVNGDQVFVDGVAAGNTREIMEAGRPGKVEGLFNLLKQRKDNWKQLEPNKDFPGVVILQIDENVPAIVVKSVFQTSAFAGYPNVSFMVGKIGGTAAPAH